MSKRPQIILMEKLRYNLDPIIIHDYQGPKYNLKYPYSNMDFRTKRREKQNCYGTNLIVPIEEFDLCNETIKDLPKFTLSDSGPIYLRNNRCSGFSIMSLFFGWLIFALLLKISATGPLWSSIFMFLIALSSLLFDKFSLSKTTKKFIQLVSNFESTTKKNLKEFKETGKISGHLFISKNTQNIIWFSTHDLEEINKTL